MANYSLVANSTFQPFTYQELAAPLDRMELYHEKLAEEYDKLSSQADVLEAMGKNDRDKNSGTYQRYKAYSDSLRKEADDLYRFGLNTESRQRLSDLRRRYNTDIVPIQNAWTKRKEEADMQMKASMTNPSLMFTRDAANTSLDEYIANPTGGFGVINGANITAQMSAMAKNLEKEVKNGTIKRTDIDPYLYDIIIEHGLDANTIRDWRNNDTLKAMFQQVMKANGVTPEALANSSNAQNILDKSTSYAEMGMWSAIGERKDEFKENYSERVRYKYQVEHPEPQTPPGDTALPGDTIDINFNDPESAGSQMKRQLATATYNFLKGSNNPKVKQFMSKYKDEESAVSDWETNGIDGKALKDMGVYYTLGNHIRNTVTKNEDIVNIWRSGMAESPKAPVSNGDSYRQNTYQGLDMYGNPISEETYSATRRGPGAGTKAGVKPGTKDWKNINELSSKGYKVKAVQLNDQETALSNYLKRTLSRLGRDGKLKLFEIKKIKGDGTYEYGNTTNTEDLPHVSNKPENEIDYNRFRRALLSNGDYMIYWLDDKGNTQERVLRRSDIGDQAVRDWQNTDTGYKSALNLYTQGKITKEQFSELARRFGVNNMANAYLDTQEVNVKDYTLE